MKFNVHFKAFVILAFFVLFTFTRKLRSKTSNSRKSRTNILYDFFSDDKSQYGEEIIFEFSPNDLYKSEQRINFEKTDIYVVSRYIPKNSNKNQDDLKLHKNPMTSNPDFSKRNKSSNSNKLSKVIISPNSPKVSLKHSNSQKIDMKDSIISKISNNNTLDLKY